MPLWVLILVLILAFGLLPVWPYSRAWPYGYWPTALLVVMVLLLFFGLRVR